MKAAFKTQVSTFLLDARFTAPDKGFTALFGPSGSGKTTLLRCVAGLARAPEGYFEVNGQVWQDESNNIFLPPHKRSVGYVFQDSRLFWHLTAEENLKYGYNRAPASERKINPEEVIGWLGLENLLGRKPHQLSGGQKQKVAIARALLTSPKLMLFDEPLASLDDEGKQEILSGLELLHGKLSIPALYVSHSVEEVSRLADHIALMSDGMVMAHGAIAEISTRLDLPMAREEGAGAVVEARVARLDPQYGLAYLEFPGGALVLPKQGLARGSVARVRILARDVGLALRKPEDTSLLNVLSCRVAGVETLDHSSVIAQLAVGETVILSKITRKSADTLGIKPGLELFAMIKSVALAKPS
ncbi:MAG: molybdenum ABC transporter ATP-binding protein [Nitrospinae bacterium]|nr:molybdenum ABC transporter ATP-binding protein [Nitrospinota bacterium]